MSGTVKLQRQPNVLDPRTFTAALDALPLGLAIAEQGEIVYANPSFAQRFDLPHKTLRTASLSSQAQASFADFQIDGRNFQIITTPAANQTESYKLEAIGRLVSGVAHDFNNVLTGIMLYCDLLLVELKKHSPSWHHAEAVRMAGQHGAALIQQLMAVARREAVEPKLFSWNHAILDMKNLLGRLIGENIQLVTELEEKLGFVKMDYAQAQQIILNLVLNARDAMPEGGQIRLITRNGTKAAIHLAGKDLGITSCIELQVTDSGVGMDQETRKHIFKRFFTTKKPGNSSGLGLATVYDLVQQMDGSIDIDSALGKRTTVLIRMPCADSVEDSKEGKSL
jgi:two-component system cell cycle sensor histidine kinase/response regulator CckA